MADTPPKFETERLKLMKEYNKGTIKDSSGTEKKVTINSPLPYVVANVKLTLKYKTEADNIKNHRKVVYDDIVKKLNAFKLDEFNTAAKSAYDQFVLDRVAHVYNALQSLLTSTTSLSYKLANTMSEDEMLLYKRGGFLVAHKSGVDVQAFSPKAIDVLDILLAMFVQKKAFLEYAKKNKTEKKTVEQLYKYEEKLSERKLKTKTKKLSFIDDFDVIEKGTTVSEKKKSMWFKLLGSIPFFITLNKSTLSDIFNADFRTGMAVICTSGAFPSAVITSPSFFSIDKFEKGENAIGSFSLSKAGLRYSAPGDKYDPTEDEPKGKVFIGMVEGDQSLIQNLQALFIYKQEVDLSDKTDEEKESIKSEYNITDGGNYQLRGSKMES